MIVFAVNVHTGGGAVLLEQLIHSNFFEQKITHLFLDERFKDENNVLKNQINLNIIRIKPRLENRLAAEFKLYHILTRLDLSPNFVLFFGNLPPLFKFYYHLLRLFKSSPPPIAPFWLFLQNALLFNDIDFQTNNFPFNLRLKIHIERFWLKFFYTNVDKLIVQNQWMCKKTKKLFPNRPVEIHAIPPYIPLTVSAQILFKQNQDRSYQFIHVGSLLKHKNLNLFLGAIKKLDTYAFDKNIENINVAIVLDNSKCDIDQKLKEDFKFKKINVEIYSKIKREEIFKLYSKSRYLVCTSSFESYYIPMYEANAFGCEVIAPTWAGYTENVDFIKIYYTENIPDLHLYLSDK